MKKISVMRRGHFAALPACSVFLFLLCGAFGFQSRLLAAEAPPEIITQPKSVSVPFAQASNVSVSFSGEVPISVYLLHAGTNVYVPARQYTLPGAANNVYPFYSVSSDAGSYQFVISNRFGAVASAVATVAIQPAPAATIALGLTNVTVGIGEFNFVSLRQGLILTNAAFGNTTHILAMKAVSSQPPFEGNPTPAQPAQWQLSLAVSNKFVVAANSGALAATGTWGYGAAANGFVTFALTNFPKAGDISRLDAFENGSYSVFANGNSKQAQAGTYRALGERRPATNTFTVDVTSPTPIGVSWLKDGVPLSAARVVATSIKANGAPPPGGISVRAQLTIPDLMPSDAGRYALRVTNLFPNPNTDFGQPLNIVTSIMDSQPSILTLQGFAETNAPAVAGALELGAGVPSMMKILDDGAFYLGADKTLNFLTPQGASNWVGTLPALVRAAVPDGQGGAYAGGADNDSGNFFLNRIHASAQVRGGAFITTNQWTTTVEGPNLSFFENSGIPHGAEVLGLKSETDGVVVAGRFRGKSRFGANAANIFNITGGITITNIYDATFNSNDRSWDLFLAKYDLLGQIVWVRGYGGTNTETLTSFSTDAVGNMYLAGSFKGGAAFGSIAVESTKSGNNYSADGYVAKLAANGDPVWVKTFGGLSDGNNSNTEISSAVADVDGNVYLLAARNQVFLTLPIGAAVGSRFVARLNAQGDMLWAQTVGTSGNSRLAVDASGDAILLDAFINANTGPTTLGAATLDRSQGTDAIVARITRGGTLYWARGVGEKIPFADIPRQAGFSLIGVSPAGEIYLAGSMPAGTTDSQSRSIGDRFDTFELYTTNSGTFKPNVGVFVRLAPKFVPAAPILTLVSGLEQTVLLQDTLVLEGRATGVPAPTYQWLLNGQPVLNATNRQLIFADLERTNRGSYVLVASNAFGVSTSAAIQVAAQLRPNMMDWTMVTATTNYAGLAAKIAADDAGNSYLLMDVTFDLRKFDITGNYLWRFDGGVTNQPDFEPNGTTFFLVSPLAPAVAPSGEVFIAGRFIDRPKNSSTTTQGNFIGRLNPDTGALLWVKPLSSVAFGQLDQATIRAFDLDGAGNVRVLISDKRIRSFSFAGGEGAAANLAALPVLLDPKNYRFALDASGGYYFYANRLEAINLGPTNLAALGVAGAQTYILARYDAAGAFQWSREFPGPGGIVWTPSLNVDANGNVVLAGGLSLQGAQTLQIGTNVLTGNGYAAKVSPAGDVLWAKAWWLEVCDSALKADGSVYLTGWFRFAPAPAGAVTRKIPFGTNYVAGSSLTGHDQFVAKLNADGQEEFIRQTGGTQFFTEDNAFAYHLDVDTRGVVTTAGYTRVHTTGGALDVGDEQMFWPVIAPPGNDMQCYYVARLEAGVESNVSVEITFTRPAKGDTSIKLAWPAGYKLQRRASLAIGAWETLNVASPYDASLSEFGQAYFQVIAAP